jgi:hypothetical protein
MGRTLTNAERKPRRFSGGWWYTGKRFCEFYRDGIGLAVKIHTKELQRGLCALMMDLGKQRARRERKLPGKARR